MRQAAEAAARQGEGGPVDLGVVIAGPTGSGKSEVAATLAQRFGGELVSADSRQVYKDLDAATSKESYQGVAQHCIDVAAPEQSYDVGRFLQDASAAVSDIRSRGKMPIVVGGTGLYIKAFLEGLSDLPKRDEAVRAKLQAELEERGESALRARLDRLDPEASAKIPKGNKQRLIRALEVCELTGKPMSAAWSRRRGGATGRWLALRIDWPADRLSERLERRCEAMWPKLLDEVRSLRARYTGREPGFESLGYREAMAAIDGTLPAEEGYALFLKSTLAYAKRQRTWFRNQLRAETIAGGSPEDMARQAERLVEEALRG